MNVSGKEQPLTVFDASGKKAIWLVLGVVGLILFIIYRNFIFFQDAFIFSWGDSSSDGITFFYPYTYLQADYFQKHGCLSWSFQYGAGQSCMLFSLMEIFNLIFYLVHPKNIHYLFIVREIIKMFLIAVLSYKYFKLLGLSNTAAFCGALLFTFCSYVVVGGTWYVFSYDTFCFVFFLFAVEKSLVRQIHFYLPAAVFCIAISQPMNLWIFTLFLAAYITVRLVFLKRRDRRENVALFLKIALYSFLGLLLSSPFLLENIIQMLESPRQTLHFSFQEKMSSLPAYTPASLFDLSACFLRQLSSGIFGGPLNFAATNNHMDAPILYCGLPCLLLAPQLFVYADKRSRIACIIMLVLFLTPLFFPYFRHALWFFKGDYYRAYGFIISVLLILPTVISLDHILKQGKIKLPLLIFTIIAVLGLLYFAKEKVDPGGKNNTVDNDFLIIILLLLLAYSAVFVGFTRTKYKTICIYIFLALLAGELIYNSKSDIDRRLPVSMSNFNNRIRWDGKPGFEDYTREIVNYLKAKEKGFFRINKDFSTYSSAPGAVNESMLFGYYSAPVYTSFNQINYVNYLLDNEAALNNEWETRWVYGFRYRKTLEALNCCRYLLTNDYNWPAGKRTYMDSIGKIGTVFILKNRYALPLSYSYKQIMKRSDFLKAGMPQKDHLLLNACYVEDADFAKASTGLSHYSIQDTLNTAVATQPEKQFKARLDDLRKDSLNLSFFSQTRIEGEVNSGENEILYLSIPFDKGWHARVDNKESEIIKLNGGMSGLLLNKGLHQVNLEYRLRYFSTGLRLSAAGGIILLLLYYFNRKKLRAREEKAL